MSKLSGTWNGGFEATTPSIWKYTIYVLFSLVIIIVVGKFAFNSAARKSNLVSTHELEAISKKYADELESN
jgi:hypothetical protein